MDHLNAFTNACSSSWLAALNSYKGVCLYVSSAIGWQYTPKEIKYTMFSKAVLLPMNAAVKQPLKVQQASQLCPPWQSKVKKDILVAKAPLCLWEHTITISPKVHDQQLNIDQSIVYPCPSQLLLQPSPHKEIWKMDGWISGPQLCLVLFTLNWAWNFHKKISGSVEMLWIEPRTSCIQSMHSTTELHPKLLHGNTVLAIRSNWCNHQCQFFLFEDLMI